MDIIAHRGASKYRPENTLISFSKALEQGVDGIELDVRFSKDKALVLSHDASIHRTGQKSGYIINKDLKQLKKIDFGSSFSQKYKGEPIATLEEVLSLTKNHEVTLHIELKNDPMIPVDLEEKVLNMIDHFGMKNKVIYSSFDHQALKRIWQLEPQAKLALLFHINLIDPFQYIDRLEIPIHALHPNHIYVNEAYINEAHKRNLKVNVYTVNQKKLAHAYKKMGVNGLITNDPLILQ